MKNTLSTILCVLLTIMLVTAAVFIGAARGWSSERDAALHALTANRELASALEIRAMDAANLAVVAARHLPAGDADVSALRQGYITLSDPLADSEALFRTDAAVSQAAAHLAESLPGMPSVQASQRDQVYISTLTRTLSQATGAAQAYADAAQDYNTRLNRSLTGQLAMFLGVKPLTAQ